jgi:DinB superfamily
MKAAINSDLQKLYRELAHSLRGLDATQTQLHPPSRPDKWSIQQIVEHLLLTYSGTETAIKARLAKRTPTRAKPSLLQHFSQYAVTRLGYFPTGREAPPPVVPPPTTQPLSGEALTQAVAEQLAGLNGLFVEAENIFGASDRCANHMVLGPLSINQWSRFHLIHGEHHIKQILAIRHAHRLAAIPTPAPQHAVNNAPPHSAK